jgi:hypothetical protein
LSNQKHFIDLSLNIIFESSGARKDALIAKINECIEMMLEEEVSISFSSSVSSFSEDQVYSMYSSAVPEEGYN